MTDFLRRHALFLAVFPLLGALFFLAIRDGNDWGGDFAVYVLEARNLASHRPLADSTYVITPESTRNHPAVYPPLASLAIAPVYALAGVDYKDFKRVLTFFLWVSLVFFYAFGCMRGLPPAVMAVAILLFGLAPLVFTLGSFVGSDALFLFVAGGAILGIDRMYRRGWDERRPWTAASLAALLLTLCYLTRAAGLALIAAFGVHELWRARRLRRFGVAGFALTGLALFICAHFLYQATAQYDSQFTLQPRQWLANDLGYLQTPAVLWAAAPAPLRYALSTSALLLIAAGFVRRLRKPELIEFCVMAWLAMLTLYYLSDKRYVLPMVPYAEMYGAEGLILLATLVRPSTRRHRALAGCGALAVLVSLINLRALDRSPVREGVTNPSFGAVCRFLRTQMTPGALVLSWNPRVFALYTDKPSALYPQNAGPEEFEARIPWRGARYLVLHKREDDVQRLDSYLKSAGPRLPIAYENADFRVYFMEFRTQSQK